MKTKLKTNQRRTNHKTNRLARGVARNLQRGKRESGSHQKPETHAEYSTEHGHRSSQIVYSSESDYTLKKFPATTGGMHPCPSLATPLKLALGKKNAQNSQIKQNSKLNLIHL